jgi:hypothetical protein
MKLMPVDRHNGSITVVDDELNLRATVNAIVRQRPQGDEALVLSLQTHHAQRHFVINSGKRAACFFCFFAKRPYSLPVAAR